MTDIFENLEDSLPDWLKDDIEEGLAQAVTLDKKQEEQKSCFFVEDNLENILEQSQSVATKRNTKWVVKLFQSMDPVLYFVLTNSISKTFVRFKIYFKNSTFLSLKIFVFTGWCNERNIAS